MRHYNNSTTGIEAYQTILNTKNKCDYCGKLFRTPTCLMLHIRGCRKRSMPTEQKDQSPTGHASGRKENGSVQQHHPRSSRSPDDNEYLELEEQEEDSGSESSLPSPSTSSSDGGECLGKAKKRQTKGTRKKSKTRPKISAKLKRPPLKCMHCGKKFNQKGWHLKHENACKKNTIRNRALTCQFCGRTFARNDAYKYHMLAIHQNNIDDIDGDVLVGNGCDGERPTPTEQEDESPTGHASGQKVKGSVQQHHPRSSRSRSPDDRQQTELQEEEEEEADCESLSPPSPMIDHQFHPTQDEPANHENDQQPTLRKEDHAFRSNEKERQATTNCPLPSTLPRALNRKKKSRKGGKGNGRGHPSSGTAWKMKMHRDMVEVKEEKKDVTCQFCHKSDVNELELGPLYTLRDVTVHYLCLLTTSRLAARGKSQKSGILGFLLSDIQKELERGHELKCKFCPERNATVECTVTEDCKYGYTYHYPCGLKNGCQFQFAGKFQSGCKEHAEKTEIRPELQLKPECPFCRNPVDLTMEKTPVVPPCCELAVFHHECMMKMAFHFGSHAFTCPMCNDKDDFQREMKMTFSIYVPIRDASWEMEPNAFAGQKQKYNTCDAEICTCPEGREFGNAKWKIVRCGSCAASAVHTICGGLDNLTWRCPLCVQVLTRGTSTPSSSNMDTDGTYSADDELIDDLDSDDNE